MRWLACLLLMIALPVQAQTFPAPNGTHVIDDANVIPPDREAALDAKLKAFDQATGRQFVVATIADMQGYDLASYGYQLGRHWGIGQKGTNEGVILFLAPNNPAGQRGPRIEVGYGLEPVMTDALSRIIITTQMMPLLRNGDVPGAIDAGADAIIQQLQLPPDEAAKRAQTAAATPARSTGFGEIVGGILFWGFIFLFVILPIIGAISGGSKRGRRHRGGTGPVVIWGGGSDWGSSSSSSSFDSGSSWSSGSDFSGGGGDFGGGGASGDW